MPPRKRRRRRSYKRPIQIGIGIALLCALPFVVLALLVATVNPNRFKPRIEAAMQQVLGREFRIHGDITFKGSIWPTLIADDVTLANFAGGSRPDMIRLDQMMLDLSPAPMLIGRVVLSNLVLLRPDILLETNAAGVGNWRFDQPATPAPAAVPAAAGAPPPPQRLLLQTLHIHDARVTWRDRVAGDTVFDVNRVSATASSTDGPVTLNADMLIQRQPVQFTAQTGPLSRLQDTKAQTPWGLFVTIDTSGAKLTISGSATRPLELKGYSLRLDAVVGELSQLNWLSPIRLPPLRGVTMTAKLLDQGGPIPDISAVSIQSSPTNLERVASGFSIDVARIDAPRLTEPIQIDVEGSLIGAPVKLIGSVGAPALFLPGARPGQKFLINIAADAVGASFVARGEIFNPASNTGMDVALGMRIPDLDRLSPLVGTRLPALKSIAFSGRLTDGIRGYLGGVALHDAKLTLPQGDLQGDATLAFSSPMGVKTTLFARRLDADALVALIAPNVGSGPDLAGLAANSPGSLLPSSRPRITAIPDTALPLGVLDLANIDVTLTVGDMLLGGSTYSDISGHLIVRDGALILDPFAMRLPGGKMDARMAVDSHKPTAPATLVVHGPGLELKPLMDALGWPVQGSGTVDIDADLHAQGRTLHALAGSLDGHLGLGIADAEVDNNVLAEGLRALVLAVDPGEAGRTKVRCAVLEADAVKGTVTIGTLVFDSTRFLLNVSGSVNLGNELLALQVRPMLRAGGPGVIVPVRLDGAFRNAKITRNAPNAGPATVFPSERGADACGPALAAVRSRSSAAAAAAPLAVTPAAPLAAGPLVTSPAVAAPPAQATTPLSTRRPTP